MTRTTRPTWFRFLIVLVALSMVTGVFAATAAARNPHFIRASADGPDADGDLHVSFKIAGLGDAVTTTVTASADATAVWACRNNGGNFPEDPKKQEVRGPVSASGEFTSGKNGQITGMLTLHPADATITCPPGQNLVLVSVTYENVQVSSPLAGTEEIAGTFSRTFFEL